MIQKSQPCPCITSTHYKESSPYSIAWPKEMVWLNGLYYSYKLKIYSEQNTVYLNTEKHTHSRDNNSCLTLEWHVFLDPLLCDERKKKSNSILSWYLLINWEGQSMKQKAPRKDYSDTSWIYRLPRLLNGHSSPMACKSHSSHPLGECLLPTRQQSTYCKEFTEWDKS